MVRIDPSSITDEEVKNIVKGSHKDIIEMLREEQSPELIYTFALAIVTNRSFFDGLLTMYLMIRNTLIKQEVKDLENLLGSR